MRTNVAQMQTEAQPAATEVQFPERHRSKEKSWKMFWQFSALAIGCICLYETKARIAWLPVADSPQMCVVVSDWWGLKAQAYYPVWRKPTGETEEYSEQWCIKYPDNSWRIFYGGHGEPPAYTYPPAGDQSYF